MFTAEGWSGEKTFVCGEGPVDIYRLGEGVVNFFGWGPGDHMVFRETEWGLVGANGV